MSHSLPRPQLPVIGGDRSSPRLLPASFPFSPPNESDRRGPLLPLPQEHGSRRGIHSPPGGEGNSWASRSIPSHRLATSSPYPHHGLSSSGPESGLTNPAPVALDNRGTIPEHGPVNLDRTLSAPESGRSFPRDQLPPLSHLLPVEAPSASSRSAYSSPWSGASSRSPRRSPPSGMTGYEPASLQASPYSDRSLARHASMAAMGAHERSLRGHSHSISSFSSPQHSTPETSVTSAYHDRQRRDRFSDSLATGSPRWPPRSDPAAGQPYSSSYSAGLSGHSHSSSGASQTSRQPESPPAGEVLGPSIWTGTHFLPRFVGERDVRGEGPCFFYDDGSHCKTFIDGEPVNAHWGVTKAGKPRKRLAVACLTCREKKIKCDPDYPKCVQCEKFGRVCKFKNAPRGHRTSPETHHFDDSEAAISPSHSTVKESLEGPSPHSSQIKASPEQAEVPGPKKRPSSRDLKRHTSSISDVDPLDISHPVPSSSKKRRQSSPSDAQMPHLRPGHLEKVELRGRASFPNDLFSSGILDYPSSFHWQADPYDINSDLVQHLVDLFFIHINNAVYRLFPRTPFLHWLRSVKGKSQDDLMLIYSMLTLASNFSPRADRKSFSKDFNRISRYAVEQCSGKYTIQLAQSRLLLGLYYFSNNKSVEGWDFSGSAIRTSSGLMLNLEEPGQDVPDQPITGYGLDREAFGECRRRTFWAMYLMDRYNTFCSGHAPIVQDEDIFIRLPCDEESYEEQHIGAVPTFEDCLTGRQPSRPISRSSLGPMAYLVLIASVWGDIATGVVRSTHRSRERYEERYSDFYATSQHRLDSWTALLPDDFSYSQTNLDRSVKTGYFQTFVAMHTLYHTAAMKLNRHAIGRRLYPGRVRINIRSANLHAQQLLRMMQALAARRDRVPDAPQPYSAPFAGCAISLACEILSAKGLTGDIPELLSLFEGGMAVLDELKPFWSSARAQKNGIVARAGRLDDILRQRGQDATMAHSDDPAPNTETFYISEPMTTQTVSEDDLIYSSPMDVYLETLASDRKESSSTTTGMISAMSLDAA